MLVNLIKNILFWLYYLFWKIDHDDINEKALILLNKWKVKTYADNRFLHKIPQNRIHQQFDTILKTLKNN